MKVFLIKAIFLMMLIPTAMAVSIHAEKSLAGMGYTNSDTNIQTQDYSGHSAIIAERGSGAINDTLMIKCDTLNKTLTIHSKISKEYMPIIYNEKTYNSLWRYNILTKNYIIGAAINSEFRDAEKINENSEWVMKRNVSFMAEQSKYLGKRHFGMRVAKPENPKITIFESFEDSIGLFVENREVVMTKNETPHNLPFSCP